jgi:outer membrane protein assembly factor BamD (BamD/ComL family)
MAKREFSPGEMIFEVDEKITNAYRLISGKLGLEWKWTSWNSITFEEGSIFGLVESLLNKSTQCSVKAFEDSEVEIVEPEDFIFARNAQDSKDALYSLGKIYDCVITQRFTGIEMSPEEMMYQAFDTYVRNGNETLAIETYSRFMMEYPQSTYVDEMLKVIQNIFMDQDMNTNIPDDSTSAYELILSNIHSSNPQENLVVMKAYEKKFPDGEELDRILSLIINEYDKLGDEYQLNYYTRKLLFSFPDTDYAREALYYLIHLQRRKGTPEWYENVIRFLLTYNDPEQSAILKKYIHAE